MTDFFLITLFISIDVPATGMYFVSYEFLLNQLTPAGKT